MYTISLPSLLIIVLILAFIILYVVHIEFKSLRHKCNRLRRRVISMNEELIKKEAEVSNLNIEIISHDSSSK